MLYQVMRDLEEFRSPNAGIRKRGWKQALQAFTIYFDGLIPIPWPAPRPLARPART